MQLDIPEWGLPPDPQGWTVRSRSDLEIVWERVDDPLVSIVRWNTEHPFYPGPKAPATDDRVSKELRRLQILALGAAGGAVVSIALALIHR